MEHYILAINPGSTSTKIAVFKDETCLHQKTFSYETDQISCFSTIISQKDFRMSQINEYLKEIDMPLEKFSAVVGRGGAIGPVKSGAYIVNKRLVRRLTNNPVGHHASNLGGVMAYELASCANITAYIYDGVTVDELDDVARITGLQGIQRHSRCHALNMRAAAIAVSKKISKKYTESNLIVAHLGGGITMSVHRKGQMSDVLIDSEGAFSPERSGRLPATTLLKYLMLNKVDPATALKQTRGNGGMVSLLGTNNMLAVEEQISSGDEHARHIQDAMIYQIAKGIGELSTTLYGEVDRIILTGAMAYSRRITLGVIERVGFIAPVVVVPGEHELEALAFGVLRVLRGEEQAHIYDATTDNIPMDAI